MSYWPFTAEKQKTGHHPSSVYIVSLAYYVILFAEESQRCNRSILGHIWQILRLTMKSIISLCLFTVNKHSHCVLELSGYVRDCSVEQNKVWCCSSSASKCSEIDGGRSEIWTLTSLPTSLYEWCQGEEGGQEATSLIGNVIKPSPLFF